MSETAFLVLGNGTVFEGRRVGADVDRIGELVFTTGMEGYIETLTDPSYYGQIVTQSFPLIGNYGIIEEDFEGRSALFGYVCREVSDTPSNFRSQYTVDEYLRRQGIPGIVGVDTRQIVRITREEGVMNAMICGQVPEDLSAIRDYTVKDAVKSVTCAVPDNSICTANRSEESVSSVSIRRIERVSACPQAYCTMIEFGITIPPICMIIIPL